MLGDNSKNVRVYQRPVKVLGVSKSGRHTDRMAQSESYSQCRVCNEYDCQASFHNKCSTCHLRGHNKRKCTPLETEENPKNVKEARVNSQHNFPLRRDSTRSLTQDEVDIAARVLIGCQEERAGLYLQEGIIDRSCRLTGLGKGKMSEIKRSLDCGKWPTAVEPQRGKWTRTEPRMLLTKINKSIDLLHKAGVMTSIPKIAASLNFHEGIQISDSTLGRILRRMGYAYRKPGPGNIILAKESKEMADYRLKYLKAVKAARTQREVVYIDESYINSRHQSQWCWIKDDSQVYIPSGKGPRYIMYAAGSRNGWVGEPVVFAHKDSGDYHNAMNFAHFEELFTSTCRTAEEILGPCVMIMDNAAYHKKLTSEKDRLGYWRNLPKKDVLEAWKNNEVPGQNKYTGPPIKYKKQVVDWLKENPPQGVCKVKTIASDYGHTVLLLPPYRPELNAIETAWAVTKNFVARKNCPAVRFSDLLGIVKTGFQQVTIDTWIKLDKKVQEEEKTQLAALEEEEARREEFRRLHPDLIFSVTNTDSDDDDEDDQELLEGIEDAVEGGNGEPVCPHGGVLPAEEDALQGLLSLGTLSVVSTPRNNHENEQLPNSLLEQESEALQALLSLNQTRLAPITEE